MEKYIEIVKTLIARNNEEEWYEFKENWFEPYEIGAYISAMSNAATLCGKEYAYLVWGIQNGTHKIVGTNIDYQIDYKKEPFQHYLARQVSPSIGFMFGKSITEPEVILRCCPRISSLNLEDEVIGLV